RITTPMTHFELDEELECFVVAAALVGLAAPVATIGHRASEAWVVVGGLVTDSPTGASLPLNAARTRPACGGWIQPRACTKAQRKACVGIPTHTSAPWQVICTLIGSGRPCQVVAMSRIATGRFFGGALCDRFWNTESGSHACRNAVAWAASSLRSGPFGMC